MTEWILNLIEQGGYWGIAFLMFIENVFPPIPSEVIMGLGGMAVARGSMAFWPLLFIGTVGSTLATTSGSLPATGSAIAVCGPSSSVGGAG